MLQPVLKLKSKPHPCQFCCVNCVYDPETDLGKYGVAYKYGKLRILLDAIGTTAFICPKCKSFHFSKEFRNEKYEMMRRKEKRKHRIITLQQIYLNRVNAPMRLCKKSS